MQALSLLPDANAANREEIEQYEAEPNCPDSDKKNGFCSPIFEKFYRQRDPAAVNMMTNITPDFIEII